MTDKSLESNKIYPNLRTAAAAVCRRWCQEQGYQDEFYQDGSWWAFPPNSVMPVRIQEVMELQHTLAQRVKIKHYSIFLSVVLLPDGCIAPHNHPERNEF